MPIFHQIRISIVEKDSLCAIASVKVSDVIYLTGIRIIQGKNGLFVGMPSKKLSSGEYQDIYFPATKAMRDELSAAVLEAYHKEKGLDQPGGGTPPPPPAGADPAKF